MRQLLSSPKFVTIAVVVFGLLVIPLTIIQVQNQQNIRQRAETILWLTGQSANTTCPPGGNGADINVTFSNTEPNKPSTAMNVKVTDKQTNKSINLGSVAGGSTKTGVIHTERQTLNAGSVTFSLTWSNGGPGSDSRTASYKAVSNCAPVPTPTTSPTPLPSGVPTPTPTVCPTLGPVKNVQIDCPNCP